MQAAEEAHIIHIFLSSQTGGPVSRIECVLTSRIVDLSISDAIEASLRCIQETSRAVPRSGGWTSFFRQIPGKNHPPVLIQGIEFPFPVVVKDFHSLNGDLIDLTAGILGKIDQCFDLTDTAEVQLWGNMLISEQRLNLKYCYFHDSLESLSSV